jgi:deoxyribonuclease IV
MRSIDVEHIGRRKSVNNRSFDVPLLGSHLSVAGSFSRAVDRAVQLGCQTVQIFTKAPNQWYGREISTTEADEFRRAIKKAKLKFPLAHDSYLINLASPDESLYRKSIEAFIEEIRRAEMLGLTYLVTHPGAHAGCGDETGLQRVIAALDEAHDRTADVRVKVLIENTAGQGTCLGHRLEHLRSILAGVKKPERLGVCIDTCHAFAAGYALFPETEYRRTMRELNRVVGRKWVKALHLNDSMKPLGSRVDRHAHIGQGAIGKAAFQFVVNDPQFRNVPMILETDKENDMDVVNLRVLRQLQKQKEPRTK